MTTESTKTTTTVSYSPGWLGLVGVILVVCKLFAFGGVETWSWWLVLLPFYAGLAIMAGIACAGLVGAALAGIVFSVAWVFDAYDQRKRRIAREKAAVWRALGGKDIK